MIKEIEALLLPFPEKVSVYCGFGILPGRSSHRPQVYLEVFRLIGFFGGNSIWFLLMGASLPLLYPRRDSPDFKMSKICFSRPSEEVTSKALAALTKTNSREYLEQRLSFC